MTPLAWIVMPYVEANGWPAAAGVVVFETSDKARAHAIHMAKQHPGTAYVIFQADTSFCSQPAEPVETPL